MSSNCAAIEGCIHQAVDHLTKNPHATVARVARDFYVPVERPHRRLRGMQSASDVREVPKLLTPDQDLALVIHHSI